MNGIVMLTGGARSGKSAFAEKIARESGTSVGYVATAVVTDDDMRTRIARHRTERPADWATFERDRDFESLENDTRFMRCDTLIIDCLTTLITNHMVDSGLDFDTCGLDAVGELEKRIVAEVDALLDLAERCGKRLIVVTNEVGQGVVPAYRMGNLFRDIAGRLNARVAEKADEVYCMISGLSLRLK